MILPLSTAGRPQLARRIRVIPTLLIDRDGRLVKSVRFGKRSYIGDPINAVRIFNTKKVDELVLMDIDASADGREPNFPLIADIVSEAFMPVAYGGGLNSLALIERTIDCGVEKVILTSGLSLGMGLVEQAARRWGSQSVVACLPFRTTWLGKSQVAIGRGRTGLVGDPVEVARRAADAGAGEIIAYSIDRDGTWQGFDLDQLRKMSSAINVPVVACGGAASLGDFQRAVSEAGCGAVAAGSLFVYQAKGRGVLISYPSVDKLQQIVFDRI